jgi:GxxExxY protein
VPKGLEKHVELTEQIIAACYEVHRILGPGLEERFYRDALFHELTLRRLRCECEREFVVEYKGKQLGSHRVDLIVEGKVLVELKAVAGPLTGVFVAQTVSERNVARMPVALLVNFGGGSVSVRRLESRS